MLIVELEKFVVNFMLHREFLLNDGLEFFDVSFLLFDFVVGVLQGLFDLRRLFVQVLNVRLAFLEFFVVIFQDGLQLTILMEVVKELKIIKKKWFDQVPIGPPA